MLWSARSRFGGDSRGQSTDLIQFGALDWLFGIELVQAVEPSELEQLLREEEAPNEVRHGAPERQVCVMDVQHVGRGEHAILLGSEIEKEACWRLCSKSA